MDFPQRGHWLLDGATGTSLKHTGLEPTHCTEQFALDHPDELIRLQSDFIRSGADLLYTPTFGGNRARLSAYGMEHQVTELNHRLVSLSRRAIEQAGAEKSILLAGDLSSAGLPIGPEEEGTFSKLVSIYAEQAYALKQAGVDLFVIETMTSLTDVRAAVLACRRFDLPVMASITVDDEGKTASGTTALTCLVVLQELGICAFGLNCSLSPEQMAPLFEELSAFAKIPLFAKPAASCPQTHDAPAFSLSPQEFAKGFPALFRAGVTIAGGCCGTTPEHLTAVRQEMDGFDFSSVKREHHSRELVLTSVHDTFCYDLDMVEFSPILRPSSDMSDQLMEMEDESYDIISIQIDTMDEAIAFAENDHMAKLPVSLLSDNELALKTALLLYSGRAVVDTRSALDHDFLQEIARKYGAVVY